MSDVRVTAGMLIAALSSVDPDTPVTLEPIQLPGPSWPPAFATGRRLVGIETAPHYVYLRLEDG